MKNQDLYKSAMDKITPSPEWETDTLKKLAQARKEMEQQSAAPKKKTVSFKKRTVLPLAAAAAVALIAIPSAHLLPRTEQALDAEAAIAEEAPLMSAAAQNAAPAAEGAPSPLRSVQPGPELEAGESISVAAGHPAPCPETAVEADEFKTTLPKVAFYQDAERNVGGERLYSQLWELDNLNPTWNLPADQLPKELPVWSSHAGQERISLLKSQMQRAADALGLTLAADEAEPCPADYPRPDLWPNRLTGRLLDAEGNTVWQLESVQNKLIFDAPHKISKDSSDSSLIRRAVYRALGCFGTLLNTDTLTYSSDANGFAFWFDPGLGNDPLQTKLLDFSFRRMEVAVGETGEANHMVLSLDPSSAKRGVYPLKPLDEAKAELAELLALPQAEHPDTDAGSQRSVSLSAEDVVGWRIEYFENTLSPDLLPVYEFLVKLPDEAAQKEQQQRAQNDPDDLLRDDIHMVRSYFISAIPDEYSAPLQPQSN